MNEELNKRIAKDFGLQGMGPEDQQRMIEKIGNLLFESVVERAVDEMDEEAMGDFDAVLTEHGQDFQEILSFLKSRTPGFDKIVAEEMARLKHATSGIFA